MVVSICKDTSAINCPSVNKIIREYKYYVVDCVSNTQPILSVEEFYWKMRQLDELPRSIVFEKYMLRLTSTLSDFKEMAE